MGNLSFDFTGRTVIVTGAARGIGLELARFFQQAKAVVYMVDFDVEELEKVAAEVGARGVLADVSKTEDAERVVATAVEETGRVDILVNNAGILRDKVLWKLTDDDWERSRCSPSTPAAPSVHPRLRPALPVPALRPHRQRTVRRPARQPRSGELRRPRRPASSASRRRQRRSSPRSGSPSTRSRPTPRRG